MKYTDLKMKQKKEFNEFPLMAAFNDEQFEEGMEKLGVKDKSELCYIGCGCYIRKADSKALNELLNRNQAELEEFMKNDDNLKDMFMSEMGNHEYQLTGNDSEVIEACSISWKKAQNDERIIRVFGEARSEYLKLCEENGWW